eukprot:m.17519 g.17519  ORF g.17519 m.17519 type:complete len:378 (-) comp8151_c0_seq1:179-1312(-)
MSEPKETAVNPAKKAKSTLPPAEEDNIVSPALSYGSYLNLDALLACQQRQSVDKGDPQHDEMLFIIIHQTYELWFKQIFFELNDVRSMFSADVVDEKKNLTILQRFIRINEIMKVLVSQIDILETMTSSDFLKFRSYLGNSSGFQSVQFRLFENALGLLPTQRGTKNYKKALNEEERKMVEEEESKDSLFVLLERWLERTPGLDESFGFWKSLENNYSKQVERRWAETESIEDDSERDLAQKSLQKEKDLFVSVFSVETHKRYVAEKKRRLSLKATHGALMIMFYRNEPRFHLPYRMLSQIMDLEKYLLRWRLNHMEMVQRMLGNRGGTGGSGGYSYLKSTIGDKYRVFADLFNLSTFLIPDTLLPKLSDALKIELE